MREPIFETDCSPLNKWERLVVRWAKHFQAAGFRSFHNYLGRRLVVCFDTSYEAEIRREIQVLEYYQAPGSDYRVEVVRE